MPLFEIGGMKPKVGGYSLRMGADYLSVDRSTGMAGVACDPTSGFIHVARLPGRTGDRLDGLSANVALRTRLTSAIGLSAEISGYAARETSTSPVGDARSRVSVGMSGAIISIDFKKPFVGNRLLGTAFLSVGAQPDGRGQPNTGNFTAAGVGAWWTSDPVALGLSATWSGLHDTAASDRGAYFRQTIAVSPTIVFSVNPDMTLFWGASAEADMTPARCHPMHQASGTPVISD
ncbi:hypothetical protein ACERNI_00320 [Camelimonas sp. ID_303_24]